MVDQPSHPPAGMRGTLPIIQIGHLKSSTSALSASLTATVWRLARRCSGVVLAALGAALRIAAGTPHRSADIVQRPRSQEISWLTPHRLLRLPSPRIRLTVIVTLDPSARHNVAPATRAGPVRSAGAHRERGETMRHRQTKERVLFGDDALHGLFGAAWQTRAEEKIASRSYAILMLAHTPFPFGHPSMRSSADIELGYPPRSQSVPKFTNHR
jgi:hypothetical protein